MTESDEQELREFGHLRSHQQLYRLQHHDQDSDTVSPAADWARFGGRPSELLNGCVRRRFGLTNLSMPADLSTFKTVHREFFRIESDLGKELRTIRDLQDPVSAARFLFGSSC